MGDSQLFLIGKAVVAVVPNNDMIHDADVHKSAGPDELVGDLTVFGARIRIAAGMVVDKYHRGRRLGKGPFDDFSWVHLTLSQTPLKQGLLSDDGVSSGQKNDLEDLPLSMTKVRRENLKDILARGNSSLSFAGTG